LCTGAYCMFVHVTHICIYTGRRTARGEPPFCAHVCPVCMYTVYTQEGGRLEKYYFVHRCLLYVCTHVQTQLYTTGGKGGKDCAWRSTTLCTGVLYVCKHHTHMYIHCYIQAGERGRTALGEPTGTHLHPQHLLPFLSLTITGPYMDLVCI
jgi:hypothetical protein